MTLLRCHGRLEEKEQYRPVILNVNNFGVRNTFLNNYFIYFSALIELRLIHYVFFGWLLADKLEFFNFS